MENDPLIINGGQFILEPVEEPIIDLPMSGGQPNIPIEEPEAPNPWSDYDTPPPIPDQVLYVPEDCPRHDMEKHFKRKECPYVLSSIIVLTDKEEKDVMRLDASIRELEQKIIDSSAITDIKKRVKDLEDYTIVIDSSITAIKTDVSTLNEYVSRIDSSVSALDSSVILHQSDIILLQIHQVLQDTSINTIEDWIDVADASIYVIERNIENIGEKITQIDSSLWAIIQKDLEQDSSILDIKEHLVIVDSSIKQLFDSSSKYDADIENLKVKNIEQDSSISDIKDLIVIIDSSILLLFDSSSKYDADIESLKVKNIEQDSSISDIKEHLVIVDSSIKQLFDSSSKYDADIESLKVKNLDQDSSISNIKEHLVIVDSSIKQLFDSSADYMVEIEKLRQKDAAQDISINANDASIVNIKEHISLSDSSIHSILLEQIVQNASILLIELRDVEQDSSIADIKEHIVAIDSSITNIKLKDVEQDSSILIIKLKDVEQDSSIDRLDSSVINLYDIKIDKTDVGNAKVTIIQEGVERGSFTMNQKEDVNINIENGVKIDDEDISATKTWSSQKIDASIALKQDTLSAGYGIKIKNNTIENDLVFHADEIKEWHVNFVEGEKYQAENAFLRLANLIEGLKADTSTINSKIPEQATSTNLLADKAFVNSTVATNAANFRGTWSKWANVPTDASMYPEDYVGNRKPTNNDYMVVQDASDYYVEFGDNLTITKGVNVDKFYINHNGETTEEKEDPSGEIITVDGVDLFVKTARSHYRGLKSLVPMKVNGVVIGINDVVVDGPWDMSWNLEIEYDGQQLQGQWRFIYTGNWDTLGKSGWNPQYQVGKAFTAAQQAAIDSGATTLSINLITTNKSNIESLEQNKVNKLTIANVLYGTNSGGIDVSVKAGAGIKIENGVISNTGRSAEWGQITGNISDLLDLSTALDSKADKTAVDSSFIEFKEYVDSCLGIKADKTVVDSSFVEMKSYVDSCLGIKADKTVVDSSFAAMKSYVDTSLATKARLIDGSVGNFCSVAEDGNFEDSGYRFVDVPGQETPTIAYATKADIEYLELLMTAR